MQIPHILSIRPLADLPNEHGFAFVGIRKNFEHVECVVVRCEPSGLHRIAGAKFWELLGWVPKCQ